MPLTKKQKISIGGALAALLLSFGLGFGAGKHGTPSKVVTTEKTHVVDDKVTTTQVETQKEQKRDVVAVVKEQVQQKQAVHKHVEKQTHEVIAPDGTKTIDTKYVVDSGATKQENTVQQNQTTTNVSTQLDTQKDTKVQEHKDTTIEKRTEITYDKPNWRVSLLGGVDVGSIIQNKFSLTSFPKVVYGAEVDRRLFWNVSIGVWGLSSGQGGISASMEF